MRKGPNGALFFVLFNDNPDIFNAERIGGFA